MCLTKRGSFLRFVFLGAQLYGLGHPRQPSPPPPPPRATLAEVTFSLFLSKLQPTVYIRIANSSRGARQLGWASCLTSAGRVPLASGTTFLHINGFGSPNRDNSRRGECHVMLRFRIYSRNSYQRSEKPTVSNDRETPKQRGVIAHLIIQ